jgi:SAM-dependent methyltransferase
MELTRCPGCGVVHATSHADPSAIYVDGYHSGQTGFHLDAEREPFASYVRQVEQRRVSVLRRLAPPPARLLDVGCGTGRFLRTAASAGYAATGLEPVEGTAASAREAGLDVRTGVLEDAPEPGSWDVVTAFHVLEHVSDVSDFLDVLRRLPRPGGAVVLEVPNWRSLCRREAGDRWSLLSPGEHITFFSKQVLGDALDKAGFEQVVVRAPSWVGAPQNLGQALTDLGLRRWARAFTPLCTRQSEVLTPRRAGWRVLSGVERLESRAGIGLTLLCTARVPG